LQQVSFACFGFFLLARSGMCLLFVFIPSPENNLKSYIFFLIMPID